MDRPPDFVRDIANSEREERPAGQLDLDEFCGILARALSIRSSELQAATSIVEDLGLDELSLASLIMAIQDLNPYFDIPDQMDVRQITLADLYHFYCVMDQGHLEGESD